MKTMFVKSGQKTPIILVIILALTTLTWQLTFASTSFAIKDKSSTTVSEDNSITLQKIGLTNFNSDSLPLETSTNNSEEPENLESALKEANQAIDEAIKELQNELNSEEKKSGLQKATEEVGKALDEVINELRSEEFKAEMRKVREDVRQAFSSAYREVSNELNSEEFKETMDRILDDVRKTLDDVKNEIQKE